MSRSTLPDSLEDSDLKEGIMLSFIEWISSNKKNIIIGFTGLLIGIILTYRLLTYQTLNAESDYLRAETLFTNLQQTAPFNPKSPAYKEFEELQTLTQRHPELKAKYEGALAQLLLISNQPKIAKPLIQDLFQRITPDHLQHYQSFSQSSLLIAEGRYQEALSGAQQLQENLNEADYQQEYTILYAFNLLRLAALHRELDQRDQEINIWKEFQNSTLSAEGLTSIHEMFKIGHLSLNEYIQSRQLQLN